jgi:hypothetical protein
VGREELEMSCDRERGVMCIEIEFVTLPMRISFWQTHDEESMS